MRRQLALIPFLLLLPLTACATGTGTGVPAPGTTTGPTVAEAPATDARTETETETRTKTRTKAKAKAKAKTNTKVTVKVAKAKPSGSRDPRWGTQYAFLRSSKLSTRQITYDLVEWYDGKQAVKACAEDGEKPAENSYCEGYYIRNNNKKLRTLTVYPDAPIHTAQGGTKPVDLQTFLGQVGNGRVIRFDIDANRIMKLEHVYLP